MFMNKNIIKITVLFAFFYMFLTNFSYAQTAEEAAPAKNPDTVLFTAEKPDSFTLKGYFDERILKKYYPIMLTVKNKDKRTLNTGEKIFYADETGKSKKTTGYMQIYENTKANVVNRAVLVGIPVTILTFGLLTLPLTAVSITHSTTINEDLENNIMKNSFRTRHLFENDTYTAFVFIPNSQKNVSEITLKDADFEGGEKFSLSAKVKDDK